ncbi:EpsG family protein [Xylanibacter oryzae]|uniref:EpsG family protein n=1 Tax=Xylanibacter oryzae TaxID=185293 RepID=UPI0004BBFB7C|nr:EpsG family protein [Xylanibacter oryzae]
MIVILFIVFVLAVLILYVEDYLCNKHNMYIFYTFAMILICVAGLRPIGCDGDSLNYEYYFQNYDKTNLSMFVEFSFRWLSSIFMHLTGNVRSLLIFYAILGVSLKMYAIRKYSDICFLAVVIYIGYYFLIQDMTQIRASVASGFFLLSIKPLAEKKRLTFLSLIFAAIFFHYSALSLLPFIFLTNNELTKVKRVLLASIVPLGYIFYFSHLNLVSVIPIPYISNKIQIYQELNERGIVGDEINVFNMVFLVEIMIYFFLLLKYDLIAEYNKYLPIMLKIMGLSIASFLVFATLPVVAFRIHDLYGIVDIILFTNIYYVIRPRLLSKSVVVLIGLSLLCIMIFYAELIN